MNYEMISRPEITVTGFSARTNNSAPDMGMVIGTQWGRFFKELYPGSAVRKDCSTYGIYTDYAKDETGDYTFAAAGVKEEAFSSQSIPETADIILPAGTYARFRIEGNLLKEIPKFWQALWAMDLPRAFLCDYEEYSSTDMANGVCMIYIGLHQ